MLTMGESVVCSPLWYPLATRLEDKRKGKSMDKVWNSTVDKKMVEGWSIESVNELVDELNNAVERIFTDLKIREGK